LRLSIRLRQGYGVTGSFALHFQYSSASWRARLWRAVAYLSAILVCPHIQQALDQTQGKGVLDAQHWKSAVIEKVRALDCATLISDVKNFLEHPEDAALLTEENIFAVLQ
jgi:hypothetical protein